MNRIFPVFIAWTLCIAVAAQDQEALTVDQSDLAARLSELEAVAIRLAQQLDAEDPARAQLLRSTIERSRGDGVADRMTSLADLLRRGRFSDAAAGQTEVAEALSRLLDELMADPQEAIAAQEAKELGEALEQIDRLSARQQAIRGSNAENSDATQDAIADETIKLAETLMPNDQPAQSPAGGSSGESPRTKAAAGVNRAAKAMRQAAEKMRGGSAGKAQEEQIAAERSLAEAREELEERLRQLREEERYRQLREMSERFDAMRAEQQSILAATIEGAAFPAASRRLQIAGRALAQRERGLVVEASAAIRLLREADAASAFLEATSQVSEDMSTAERLLEGADLGDSTQAVENAIILALEDAKECLDEAAEQARESSGEGQGESPASSGEPPLLAKIAELRMIRTLQKRVLARTEAVQVEQEANGKNAEAMQDELQDLAGRQRRLSVALDDLLRGGS